MLVLDCDPIDDAPILDLRLRKGVRRNGVRLAVASARPGALDPNAELTFRFAPGAGEALLVALDAALSDDAGNLGGAASAAGSNADAVRGLAAFLRDAGEDVVIVYGERLLARASAARALLNLAARLGLARARRRRAARAPERGERPRPARGRLRSRTRPRLRRRWRRRDSTRRGSPRAWPPAT